MFAVNELPTPLAPLAPLRSLSRAPSPPLLPNGPKLNPVALGDWRAGLVDESAVEEPFRDSYSMASRIDVRGICLCAFAS